MLVFTSSVTALCLPNSPRLLLGKEKLWSGVYKRVWCVCAYVCFGVCAGVHVCVHCECCVFLCVCMVHVFCVMLCV